MDLVQSKADKRGFSVLRHNVYRYKISHDMKGSLLQLYVHVPCFMTTFDLYRLIILPSAIGDGALFMEVSPQESFLAVARGDDARGLVLTAADLKSCRHEVSDHLYLCANREVHRDVRTTTCLGALWARQAKIIHDLCPALILRDAERIVPLSKDEVAVVSTSKAEAVMYCPGRSLDVRHRINVTKVIRIPAGCKLTLSGKEFQSFSDVNFVIEVKLKLSLQVDILNVTWNHWSDSARDLARDLLSGSTAVTKDEILRLHQGDRKERTTHYVYGTWTLTLSVLVIMCLVVAGWAWYRSRKRALKPII